MASAKPKKKNPRLASGRKRVRQDVKINAANTSLRSKYRTAVKNVEKAVLAGDKTKATELFAKMQSTNAWLKAPSANRRRNRLGMRNATLKASVSALAPNIEAIRRSRTRPVTREARVRRETVEAALNRDTAGSVAPLRHCAPSPKGGHTSRGQLKPVP